MSTYLHVLVLVCRIDSLIFDVDEMVDTDAKRHQPSASAVEFSEREKNRNTWETVRATALWMW